MQQQQSVAPRHIPLDLLLLCAQHLPANDVACTVRALCREAHAALSHDPRHRTARLDAPLPPHVSAWSPAALDNARGPFTDLPFARKLSLPAVAAATGSTTNLELAWRLVRPCLCPELPLRHYTSLTPKKADVGVMAARSGRPDVVVWLVERGCPLVPACTARAAAVHCSLAGLRKAWGALLRLDPGLGAEAEACWRAVYKAACDGSVGSSGAGGTVCEEVQGKGAWLYARHWEYRTQLLQRQQEACLQAHNGAAEQSAGGAGSYGAPAAGRGGSSSGGGGGDGSGGNSHGFVRGILSCCVAPLQEDSSQQESTLVWLPSDWQWQPRRQATAPVAAGPAGGCFRYPAVREKSFKWVSPYERVRRAAWAGDGDAVRRMRLEQQQQDAEDGGGDGGVSWRHAAAAAFIDALTAGHLVAARALLQAGYRPKDYCYGTAAEVGSLPTLRWLLLEARPCPFGTYQHRVPLLHSWPVATSAEEEREAVEVLQLLAEAGCTGGCSLVDAAARRGSVPLLLEALRLAPVNRDTVFFWCGHDKRLRVPVTVVSDFARAGAPAGLKLCLEGVPRARMDQLGGFCYEAWAHAACHGDMATLECLARLRVPWDSRELDRALRGESVWGYVPKSTAPVTVPVLRWAVEEVGCWELGAGACRRLAGGVEVALRKAREEAAPDGGAGGVAERGEWGWSSWPRCEVFVRDMEAVGAWLKARAERLEREEGAVAGTGGAAGAVKAGLATGATGAAVAGGAGGARGEGGAGGTVGPAGRMPGA